jgi:F-type H+-transporting ATPase subunit delta
VNVTAEKGHETGLGGRYANAVFELAQEQNAVDRVAADFATLKRLIETTPELAMLVRSPLLTAEDQAKALKPVLAKIEASTLTTNFLLLLAAKRRLRALDSIIASYTHLLAKLKGEVEAEVTSARPLSETETGELKAILKTRLGREPRLHTRVDAALLGGLVVKVGSRMIDSSIATKLAGIRAAMKG